MFFHGSTLTWGSKRDDKYIRKHNWRVSKYFPYIAKYHINLYDTFIYIHIYFEKLNSLFTVETLLIGALRDFFFDFSYFFMLFFPPMLPILPIYDWTQSQNFKKIHMKAEKDFFVKNNKNGPDFSCSQLFSQFNLQFDL